MTKKDYELIARTLKDAAVRSVYPETGILNTAQKVLLNNLVASLSYKLRQENPRFDADRFADAVYAYEADIQWPKGAPEAERLLEETKQAQAEKWSRELDRAYGGRFEKEVA